MLPVPSAVGVRADPAREQASAGDVAPEERVGVGHPCVGGRDGGGSNPGNATGHQPSDRRGSYRPAPMSANMHYDYADYKNNRKMLGPNIIANYELGANMSLTDFSCLKTRC